MDEKERKKLDRQLDEMAQKLLMDAYKGCFSITEGIYQRLLIKIRDNIDTVLNNYDKGRETTGA